MQTDIPFRTVRAQATRQSADVLATQMRAAGQTALKVHFDRCPRLLENQLAFLAAFDFLTHLALVSGEVQSLAALQHLPKLKRLELNLLQVKDESCPSLPSLHVLGILDCSVNVLQLLPALGSLRALSLVLLAAPTLPAFTTLSELRWLKIERCHRMLSVSCLKGCVALERVVLLELPSLASLATVAQAPSVQELIVANASALSPQAFDVFAQHPTLRRAFPGISAEHTERFRQSAAMLRCPIMESYYGTTNQFFDLPYGDDGEFMIRLR